jgi:cell division protein FtsN
MMHDYAKPRLCGTSRRRRYADNKSHAGLWLFTVFLFVVFTVGLVLLGKYHRHSSYATTYTEHAKREPRQVQVKEVVVAKRQKQYEESGVHLSPVTSGTNAFVDQETLKRQITEEARVVSTSSNVASTISPKFEFTTPQAANSHVSTSEQDTAKIAAQRIEKIAAESEAESKKLSESKAVRGGTSIDQLQKTDEQKKQQKNEEQYMLEVIKSKSKVAAEKMRARLALIGIESSISMIKEQSVTYYKISLGPFDKNTAEVKQQLLKKNGI